MEKLLPAAGHTLLMRFALVAFRKRISIRLPEPLWLRAIEVARGINNSGYERCLKSLRESMVLTQTPRPHRDEGSTRRNCFGFAAIFAW
jgi:hypothetical protein